LVRCWPFASFAGVEAAWSLCRWNSCARTTAAVGDRGVIWRPLFPQYLFATIDPARDIPRLCEIDGVEDVLRPGGRLTPIADDVIEAIRRAERLGTSGFSAGSQGKGIYTIDTLTRVGRRLCFHHPSRA
jgi:hypothetical protein